MLNKSYTIFALLFYFVTVIYFWTKDAHESGKLLISFVDVGQGDAVFIKTPEGQTILIDGGPDNTIDIFIDRHFLYPTCHLDMVILTHPHSDHLYGLQRLLKRCSVGVLTFNDVSYSSSSYKDFLLEIKENNKINKIVTDLFAGDILTVGNLTLRVIWPNKNKAVIQDENAYSASVLVDYGVYEFLLTGDAESTVIPYENIVKFALPFIDDGLDVLKIPHHGSPGAADSYWYDSMKPKTCIFSYGEGNRYGHPSKSQLDLAIHKGCNVLTTAEKGDIELMYSPVL